MTNTVIKQKIQFLENKVIPPNNAFTRALLNDVESFFFQCMEGLPLHKTLLIQ